MNYYRASDRRFCIIAERNLTIDVIQLCVAGSVCFYIAHVALMSCRCVWRGMRLIGGIEMPACRTCIGCAAIAKFMYVKAMLSGRQAHELCVHLHAIGAGSECNSAAHVVAGSGVQHRNAF